MKNIVILILILSGFFNQSYGQSAYRIKPFADKGNFIYPPHSKLKHSCNETTVKKTCRYQYIYIDSLKMTNGDYYSVLNLLNNAEYFSSRDSIDEICFDTECYGCYGDTKGTQKQSFNKTKRKPNSKTTTKLQSELNKKIAAKTIAEGSKICDTIQPPPVGRFCKIKYSYDQKAFLLQIDYSAIIDDQIPDTIESRFFEVARDLLIEFNKRERSGVNGFGWPTSISQDIVEKVFELIPIPNQSSLLRYVAQIDNDKSFVLLNPKIKLKVDAVDTLTDENEDWQYRLVNSNLITLIKDNNGNTIQSPFLNFQYKTSAYMPTNTINGKNILQASSSDIQLSSTLNKCPYIFLFQNKFKKNSKFSTTDCLLCGGKEWNMFECNSVLFHYKTIPIDFYNSDNGFDKNKIDYFSAFGYRNLITPVISIYLNNIPCDIILNTTLRQLRLKHNLPANLKMLRLHNGKYKRVNLKSDSDIILLPSDFVKF